MRIGLLLRLAGTAPSVDALRAHVAERMHALPALGTTLCDSGPQPRWDTLAPDLNLHVRSHLVPPGSSVESALQHLRDASWPRHAPLWDLTLVHGYAGDEYGLFYRTHHAVQDAAGIVFAVETLLSATPVPLERSSAVSRSLDAAPPPSLRHKAAAVRRLARATAKSTRWPHPHYHHSTERTFRWTSVPDTALRSAATPHGGTCNDAFIAALALAVLAWEAEHHPQPPQNELAIAIPVNLRHPQENNAPGNYVIPVQLRLPGLAMPLPDYVRETVRATAWVKKPQHCTALRSITDAIPPSVYRKSIERLISPRYAAVAASQFVMRNPLAYKNDPVRTIMPLTVLPRGAPLSVVLVRYQGTSTACFVTDSALPGMDALHHHWQKILQSGLAD
ncbi:hypothetical protein GCM10010446_61170 [Streptomyces enissocaesilis]|uniref:O-acyltransferase WSD1-like N-terminal domain-containing protein n=2 Tax=Streptomyces enissocaesilis TaxID=332589 RepID=A0ABN3XLU0_9ACTN